MGITGSSFSKGDVFRFADEVKNLIELLNGIVIQSQDKERLNKIIFQKEKIDVNDNITMNRKWKIKMYKNDH